MSVHHLHAILKEARSRSWIPRNWGFGLETGSHLSEALAGLELTNIPLPLLPLSVGIKSKSHHARPMSFFWRESQATQASLKLTMKLRMLLYS